MHSITQILSEDFNSVFYDSQQVFRQAAFFSLSGELAKLSKLQSNWSNSFGLYTVIDDTGRNFLVLFYFDTEPEIVRNLITPFSCSQKGLF